MRGLVINYLKGMLAETEGYGIPRYFDCPEEDMLTNAAELDEMTDEELFDVLVNAVGFQG